MHSSRHTCMRTRSTVTTLLQIALQAAGDDDGLPRPPPSVAASCSLQLCSLRGSYSRRISWPWLNLDAEEQMTGRSREQKENEKDGGAVAVAIITSDVV